VRILDTIEQSKINDLNFKTLLETYKDKSIAIRQICLDRDLIFCGSANDPQCQEIFENFASKFIKNAQSLDKNATHNSIMQKLSSEIKYVVISSGEKIGKGTAFNDEGILVLGLDEVNSEKNEKLINHELYHFYNNERHGNILFSGIQPSIINNPSETNELSQEEMRECKKYLAELLGGEGETHMSPSYYGGIVAANEGFTEYGANRITYGDRSFASGKALSLMSETCSTEETYLVELLVRAVGEEKVFDAYNKKTFAIKELINQQVDGDPNTEAFTDLLKKLDNINKNRCWDDGLELLWDYSTKLGVKDETPAQIVDKYLAALAMRYKGNSTVLNFDYNKFRERADFLLAKEGLAPVKHKTTPIEGTRNFDFSSPPEIISFTSPTKKEPTLLDSIESNSAFNNSTNSQIISMEKNLASNQQRQLYVNLGKGII